ncbi:MAG TPA: hypothetical protein VNA69_11590 [Thermoanaerobaculia bacterium]|nr:hypothetical protein [Thermoanaerobaculia bacterium]
MTVARRETLLAAAFALWGLALAISLASVWDRPAPPDQLPGLATAQGFDAHGPFRFVLGLIVLPITVPLLARPLIRRLAVAQAWASNAAIAVAIVAIWYAVIARDPLWILVPFGAAFAAFALLAQKPLEFTRHDWILLPAFNATLISVIDLSEFPVQRAVIVAAALVLAVRIAVAFLRSPLPPAFAFLLAPLGVALQTSFFARDQRYFGWHALLLALITPFVMRALLRDRRRALAALAFVIYPIVVFTYPNATGALAREGKPRVNFFEDSHSIPIASEYLRGERPYRDQLPAHGLLEDGLFDYLAFQLRDVTLGSALHSRAVVGLLNAVAIYALGFAMTGSPEVGLLTYFFWQLTTSAFTIRITPALFTLVLIALAVRKRDPRYFIAAGFGAVLCGITSLDYALYTTIVLAVAVVRRADVPSASRGGGRDVRPPVAAAIGIAAGVVPLFLAFAAFGILDDFFRTTFVEIPRLAGAYTLSMFGTPESIAKLPVFPELLAAWLRLDSLPHLTWCAVAIATAVLLTKRRTRLREPFVLVGLWVVLGAISYGERHHLYFRVALAAILIPAAWFAIRRRVALAPTLVIALVIASMPTVHLGIVGMVRRLRGPEAEWNEVRGVPRARGALLNDIEAAQLASAKKYVDLTLKPGETYFDFTNRAILFYLLRRDNPVRFVETAYYEPEEAQREVIAALEANPNVRAALVPDPPGGIIIDGVPNQTRAPLVWQYLQQNFHPDFHEGQVTFWRRK